MLKRVFRSNKPELQLDAAKLLAAQHFSRGVYMTVAFALLTIALWIYVSLLFDRYFPWVSMIQGIVIGRAMQHFGRGLDWRFAAVAATVTAVAAVLGSFLVALFLTGREFGTGALALVDEISLYTVRVFLLRDFGVVGLIYMVFAAVLAAFYAGRRLAPAEVVALRRARAGRLQSGSGEQQDAGGERQ